MANNTFINKGVFFQQVANTKEDAFNAFKYSCECCAKRGLQMVGLDCNSCDIAVAHGITIAAFDAIAEYAATKEKEKEERGVLHAISKQA